MGLCDRVLVLEQPSHRGGRSARRAAPTLTSARHILEHAPRARGRLPAIGGTAHRMIFAALRPSGFLRRAPHSRREGYSTSKWPPGRLLPDPARTARARQTTLRITGLVRARRRHPLRRPGHHAAEYAPDRRASRWPWSPERPRQSRAAHIDENLAMGAYNAPPTAWASPPRDRAFTRSFRSASRTPRHVVRNLIGVEQPMPRSAARS